jgi:hypothetical protein
MRVGLFGNAGRADHDAARAGLEALEHRIVGQAPGAWTATQAEKRLDAVVVCGIRGRLGEVADFYAAAGVPVALLDLPHLRDGAGAHQLRVTPPSHTWLPTFDGTGLPPTDRLDALGVVPATRKRVKGQSILVVGQVGGDSAHGMPTFRFREWAEASVRTLRSLTDGRIIWRCHPKDRYRIDGADAFSDPAEESLADALERSWLVVAYNSTAGLEAMIAGLPVVAEGPAVYSPLAWRLNQWSRVAPADPVELSRLLAALAYTQWSLEEIATGFPLDLALRGAVLPGAAPASAPAPAPASPPADAPQPPAEPAASPPPAAAEGAP